MKSSQAQAAAAIRSELKVAFPGITFGVRSDSGSMTDSVHISWIDGPTVKEVEAITGKYQQGHFDGMTDMYEYSNTRKDIPQTKYVMESRTISQARKDEFNAKMNWSDSVSDFERSRHAHTELYQISFYQKPAAKVAPVTEIPTAITAEGVELVKYSEKAVAVFGNTKPIKDTLKELGGKFNPFLKRNGAATPGWIFSARHEGTIRATLQLA